MPGHHARADPKWFNHYSPSGSTTWRKASPAPANGPSRSDGPAVHAAGYGSPVETALALACRLARRAALAGALATVAVEGAACNALYDLSALGPAPDGEPEAGSDAARPPDAAPPACPAGDGPPMIAVSSFCIDTTEVTNEQYEKFLDATQVTRPALPAACDYKKSLTPDQGWPVDPADRARPVRYVDWCDALSYCLWANKRLCGRLGGGALRATEAADPRASEWAVACSGGRPQDYPYGASYEDGRCNARGDAAVSASTSCEGVPGVFDMVGNVAEWLDACESSSGAFDECRVAGGSFLSAGPGAKCTGSAPSTRGARSPDQGIRCCGP